MKKCLHCGAEMPDEERFCSECGAEFAPTEEIHEAVAENAVAIAAEDSAEVVLETEATSEVEAAPVMETEVKLEEVLDGAEEAPKPVDPIPEKPVKKIKIKWWHIAVPVALVVAIIAALLLGPFFIYLAPKTVLTKALTETANDLSARAEGTPLTVMSNIFEGSQKNTVNVEYEIFQEMLGDMSIEMEAQVDSSIKQGQIGIVLDVMGEEADMNLYMDREVAAINLDMYTGEDYYGIYYDTFGEDIRNNEFMYSIMGKENVEMLDEAVDTLDQLMSLETITPEQQAESLKKYGEVILAFTEEKDAQVGKAEISVDGKNQNCKTVAFTITREEYSELMLQLVDIAETDPVMINYYQSLSMDFKCENWNDKLDNFRETLKDYEDGETECVFTFYLHGGKVVQVDVAYEETDAEWLVYVNFGSDASVKDIVICGEFVEDDEDHSFEITLSTKKNDGVIVETLCVTTQEEDDDPVKVEIGYEWNRENGDFLVHFQDYDEEISGELNCVLEVMENGYHFSIPAVEELVESMGEDTEGIEMSIDITMTTGAEIEVPETIKDIAKMTESDLMGIASKIMEM